MRRRRLAQVVTERAQHHDDFPGAGQVVDGGARFINDHERVHPDVAFRMPQHVLLTADERPQFRQQAIDDVELQGQGEPDRRTPSHAEELLDLAPDALRGKVVERNDATELARRAVE